MILRVPGKLPGGAVKGEPPPEKRGGDCHRPVAVSPLQPSRPSSFRSVSQLKHRSSHRKRLEPSFSKNCESGGLGAFTERINSSGITFTIWLGYHQLGKSLDTQIGRTKSLRLKVTLV